MSNLEDKYAIVILNYNNSMLTIEATRKIKTLNNKIKTIIVDNCSTDDSEENLKKEFEKEEEIWLIFNKENTGYASGNNVGLRYIDENLKEIKYAIIMNPDIDIEDYSVIKNVILGLENDEKLAVLTTLTIYNGVLRFPNDAAWRMLTKRYLCLSGTIIGKFLAPSMRYNEFNINSNGIAYVDIVQGCFFAIKMDIAKKVGFFDEHTFLYGEETILAKKIKNIGYNEGVLIYNFVKHNHQEKNKRMIKKKNKLFDMKCFYNSRKYIIEKYSDASKMYIFFAKLLLNIDYFIKRVFISIKRSNK